MSKKTAIEMMLIEKSKIGRKDGAYTRIFGDQDLGSFFSRVHSTTISSGNALEKLIYSQLNSQKRVLHDFFDFNSLINLAKEHTMHCLNAQQMQKQNMLPLVNGKRKKQDFYFIDKSNKTFYIIELKGGETFDTKKVVGEVDSLNEGKKYFEKNLKNFKIIPYFVAFNQQLKSEIIKGTKKSIEPDWCITGQEFCEKFQINLKQIDQARKEAAIKNKRFLRKFLDKEYER